MQLSTKTIYMNLRCACNAIITSPCENVLRAVFIGTIELSVLLEVKQTIQRSYGSGIPIGGLFRFPELSSQSGEGPA